MLNIHMKINKSFLFLFIGLLFSCSITNVKKQNNGSTSKNPSEVKFTILHFNDFYEIAPLEVVKLVEQPELQQSETSSSWKTRTTYNNFSRDFLSSFSLEL